MEKGRKKMKATLKAAVIASALIALALGGDARAGQDPTKYDCRVVVGYRTVNLGTKPPTTRQPIWECPHKDKMAAGQCETSWLFGMRCRS